MSTDDEIWYPGKVVDLKLCEGLEELTVEYTTLFTDQHRLQKLQDTITADKIRPATPTSDQKSFEMMDKVEAFYNNGWSSGQISMVLGDNTYSVCLYTSMETILFKHSDLRIHREWKDGVWKMADKVNHNLNYTSRELFDIHTFLFQEWFPEIPIATNLIIFCLVSIV